VLLAVSLVISLVVGVEAKAVLKPTMEGIIKVKTALEIAALTLDKRAKPKKDGDV
jgi:hypothetical protein